MKRFERKPYKVDAVQWEAGKNIVGVIEVNGHARFIHASGDKLLRDKDWIVFHNDRIEILNDEKFNDQYREIEVTR